MCVSEPVQFKHCSRVNYTFNSGRIGISLLSYFDFGNLCLLFFKWSVFKFTNFVDLSKNQLFISLIFFIYCFSGFYFTDFHSNFTSICFEFTTLFLFLRRKLKMTESRPFFFSHKFPYKILQLNPINFDMCSFSFISKHFIISAVNSSLTWVTFKCVV